ncbi:metallophosphoesterase family protein [Jeotgalibacillus haloalkalitolerans]|uniref:Phosphoesterase n=1 Tax=Jeotgalibacillus haloalkalitolerans TaxID=3104292 RepID=A0ABU5KPY1_9BACL|nr:metallophosphoesterase family protein [Jeotgalibacillus sp. HH7-29]MDZ5713315.1 metallophosphoesterase family protein [Jeotgalibacillus sp. HH7-29]
MKDLKIIVLSDTHMPRMAKSLPPRLLKELNTVDLILHTGDFNTIEVLHELEQFAPVLGVVGNADDEAVLKVLPEKQIVDVGSFKIGMVHGHGKGKTTEKRALEAFSDDRIDLLIYGHSHIPSFKTVNGLQVLNPGSPTDKRRQKQFSFVVLTVEDTLGVEFIYYDSKK